MRGLIHLHMKANDLAKEAFMEALTRDVKCFEAFEMLVGGEMMSNDEGERRSARFEEFVALTHS